MMLGRETTVPLTLLTPGGKVPDSVFVAELQGYIRGATRHMVEAAGRALRRQTRNYDGRKYGKELKVRDEVYFFNPSR